MMQLVGIDYGSKFAGTTVVAYIQNNATHFIASKKNQNADQFIIDWAKDFCPTHIFIDAPLSLPGVFSDPTMFNDYFYRQADRALRAMSPMFIGGLTARAMQLKSNLIEREIEVLETYPSYLVDLLQLDRTLYKKQKEYIPNLIALITSSLNLPILASSLPDWHHVDALLALASGLRYSKNEHLTFGNLYEGQIII